MTTPSFSVSRMDPIRWSHCGFPLLKTLSLCRIAAIEKAYARNSGEPHGAFVTAEQVSQECGQYSRLVPKGARRCIRARRTRCSDGKCIATTKARSASELAELAELLRDNKPKGCSVDYAASVALPYLR